MDIGDWMQKRGRWKSCLTVISVKSFLRKGTFSVAYVLSKSSVVSSDQTLKVMQVPFNVKAAPTLMPVIAFQQDMVLDMDIALGEDESLIVASASDDTTARLFRY